MSYCILIPTLNRKDLLKRALNWYISNLRQAEIIVLDNGKQGIASGAKNLFIFELEQPLGVAASWNWLIQKAMDRGHHRYLLLHDDIVLKRYESEIMQVIADFGDGMIHMPESYYEGSAILLNYATVQEVGAFDENFGNCFFELDDYIHRAKLAGIPVNHDSLLNPQIYNTRSTIERNPLIVNYAQNKSYYLKKWGGLPTKENYKTPFGK